MKKIFFTFMMVCLLGCLNLSAQDSSLYTVVGLDITFFSVNDEDVEEAADGLTGAVYADDEDVYFMIFNAEEDTDEALRDLFAFYSLAYTGPVTLTGKTFKRYEGSAYNIAEEVDAYVEIMIGNNDDDNLILVTYEDGNEIYFFGDRFTTKANEKMTKLVNLWESSNRPASLSKAMQRAYPE